jgi:hypothetical protein
MKFYFSLILIVVFAQTTTAQKINAGVKTYLETIRISPYDPVPVELLNERNTNEVLSALPPYLSDTSLVVRSKAFYILRRIAAKSNDRKAKQKAIKSLVDALSDASTQISAEAIQGLQNFRASDFDVDSRNAIGILLATNATYQDQLIRLAGFLKLREQVPLLNELVRSSQNAKTRWSARLALSRIGDEVATNHILAKLSESSIGDDFVYDILPDLIYTRNISIFNRLVVLINSDAPDCSNGNPDSGRNMPCGYRIIEQIAPVVKNFPIKTDKAGELIIADYAASLRSARDWFSKNKSLELLADTY